MAATGRAAPGTTAGRRSAVGRRGTGRAPVLCLSGPRQWFWPHAAFDYRRPGHHPAHSTPPALSRSAEQLCARAAGRSAAAVLVPGPGLGSAVLPDLAGVCAYLTLGPPLQTPEPSPL